MIARSILAAVDSRCFERVIVSTDDEEIAEVAKFFGAEVPFLRPTMIADDYTGTIPVIKHAVKYLLDEEKKIEKVCCIYATAPFLLPQDILKGVPLLENETINYAFSVTSFPFPIQRAIKLDSEDKVEMFQSEMFQVRSQDLDQGWHDAGQFYWGKVDAWLNEKVIFKDSVGIKLPRYRVQDIDTEEDWIRAEAMYKALNYMDPV